MNKSHFETSLEALQADHTRALSESAESRAKAEAEARERSVEEMEKVREEVRVAKREAEDERVAKNDALAQLAEHAVSWSGSGPFGRDESVEKTRGCTTGRFRSRPRVVSSESSQSRLRVSQTLIGLDGAGWRTRTRWIPECASRADRTDSHSQQEQEPRLTFAARQPGADQAARSAQRESLRT